MDIFAGIRSGSGRRGALAAGVVLSAAALGGALATAPDRDDPAAGARGEGPADRRSAPAIAADRADPAALSPDAGPELDDRTAPPQPGQTAHPEGRRPGPDAAAPAPPQEWEPPRTAAGHPDLQGNWTNATVTPIQRPEGQEPAWTPEQAAWIEGRVQDARAAGAADSDPDRGPPPVGGIFTGNARADAASGGTGGYNSFFIDAGERIAVFNGELRTSLVVDPPNGRLPRLTDEGRRRMALRRRARADMGEFDNPENRPLAERCIMSFGSNAGPPMLPNYFYNNNYTIVQTPDHVMIMTEMVHDVRVIRMGEPRPLPAHVRPWMGDSWGRWEGDTLVVETTNLHPDQTLQGVAPSEELRVVERFTRAGEHVLNYEFTVHDPVMWERSWSGEVPFTRQVGLVYEYACHEGNYAMENVLRGARAQERREGN